MELHNLHGTDYPEYNSLYAPTRASEPSAPADRKKRSETGASSPVIATDNGPLNALPQPLFELLRPHLRRSYVSKEKFLFQQDDPLEYIYFPETAVVSEFHILDDGRMVEISITGREGMTGVATLYQAERVANCGQVTLDGNLLKIERSLLRKVAKAHPELLVMLHGYLEDYIRQISQKAVCNMYHSVEKRFCTWLLMLQDRSSRKMLKLTHEQIARTLGVYRPSITCVALDMRKNGLIDYSRGGIAIREREKIESMACGCYFELDYSLNRAGSNGSH
jgi:CRP-like cAMP-binding protein